MTMHRGNVSGDLRERQARLRASLALGLAAIVGAGFYFGQRGDLSLVRIGNLAAVAVVLGFGALAVLGGWLGRRVLTVAAGAGFAVAAVVQLVQLGRDTNWFGGTGSTLSFWLGLAVGLLAVGLAPQTTDPDAPAQAGRPDRTTGGS
jgi:hypothetical protein